MTKEQHDNLAEYLKRMQKPLGHHSWWYTNRGNEDCVNVKMHCWVDPEEVTALLTEKERQAIEILGIDVGEWCESSKWQDIEIIANDFLEDLQNAKELQHDDFRVDSLDWGGRSGGWLCIVFDFDGISDWLEGSEYVAELIEDGTITKKEAKDWEKQAQAASDYISLVHEYVKKEHRVLCDYYEEARNYVEPLREYIADCIDSEAASIEHKTENLRQLAKH